MRREGTSIQRREETIAPSHGREREREREKKALAFLFICFSVPGPVLCKLGRPGVLFVLPEVLTPGLDLPLFYFRRLSLPGLLATAILDSFSLLST